MLSVLCADLCMLECRLTNGGTEIMLWGWIFWFRFWICTVSSNFSALSSVHIFATTSYLSPWPVNISWYSKF